MIIRETEHTFVMTRQHDHAQLSGDIARRFHPHLFMDDARMADALLAVYEHDRAWIKMDHTPVLNDGSGTPYSFMDYPLLPKLLCYRNGIDEVEEAGNPYAALLCSLHYATFEQIRTSQQADVVTFYHYEKARQKRIKTQFAELDEEMVLRHLRILKLCDGLSLYVCLNEPGVDKEREHPWYKTGFETSLVHDEHYLANWVNEQEIRVAPSLFEETFTTTLTQKHVPKARIQSIGLNEAYREAAWTEQRVTFVAITN